MWKQAIDKRMLTLICLRIGHCGTAQQADTDHIIMDIMTVLPIIEQTYSIAAFAQVDPFLRTGFKSRPVPTGIAMCGALYIAPLDLIGCRRTQNVYGKGSFEEDMTLTPINARLNIEAWTMIV